MTFTLAALGLLVLAFAAARMQKEGLKPQSRPWDARKPLGRVTAQNRGYRRAA